MHVTIKKFANATKPVYVCRHRDGRTKTLTESQVRELLDAFPDAVGTETYDALAFPGL